MCIYIIYILYLSLYLPIYISELTLYSYSDLIFYSVSNFISAVDFGSGHVYSIEVLLR